jgi:hypothetical protein
MSQLRADFPRPEKFEFRNCNKNILLPLAAKNTEAAILGN